VGSGVAELDRMCGGGMYRDSIILVSGATGTGKTLTVTHYIKAAIDAGERAILFGAEESREQLSRNAASWGVDFAKAERDGLLRIICRYPEIMGLEDHLLQVRRDIDDFKPARVAVDSMSAYERAGSKKSFREFVVGLTSHIKHLEITGLFTNTTAMLMGGDSITETHISTITDTIILLRYVELHGEMRRGLAILKMRGTQHEKQIREYVIDSQGMHIKHPFRGIHGILTGTPTYMFTRERDNLADMFSAPL
jgi:circadian clock protein KaiC